METFILWSLTDGLGRQNSESLALIVRLLEL